MKWILIVIIFQYKGGIVEKQFNMPNETTCKLVALTVKKDLKQSIVDIGAEYNGPNGPKVITTCTMMPPQ